MEALFAALGNVRAHQPLNARTGAVHAAIACTASGNILTSAEDVGRHNALDKLVGTLARAADDDVDFILVTSRISYEMVDKALIAGVGLLVGISAPTSGDRSCPHPRPDPHRAGPPRCDAGRA